MIQSQRWRQSQALLADHGSALQTMDLQVEGNITAFTGMWNGQGMSGANGRKSKKGQPWRVSGGTEGTEKEI